MQKDTEHELYFKWLVEELKLKGTLCEKTIIYCQTIKTRVQNVCAYARSLFSKLQLLMQTSRQERLFFELKSNFISIQNFKAGNVKPPGMHWSKDF